MRDSHRDGETRERKSNIKADAYGNLYIDTGVSERPNSETIERLESFSRSMSPADRREGETRPERGED